MPRDAGIIPEIYTTPQLIEAVQGTASTAQIRRSAAEDPNLQMAARQGIPNNRLWTNQEAVMPQQTPMPPPDYPPVPPGLVILAAAGQMEMGTAQERPRDFYDINTDSYRNEPTDVYHEYPNSINSTSYVTFIDGKLLFHINGNELFALGKDGQIHFNKNLAMSDAIHQFFDGIAAEFPKFIENIVKSVQPKTCHICGNNDCHPVAVCQVCEAEIKGLD